MNRFYVPLFAALLAATPCVAQTATKASAPVLPAGWQLRTDNAAANAAKVSFVDMDGGFHVTTGPAAIFWNAANNMTGNYNITATFTQTKAPAMGHPEAYGIFVGGKNMDQPDASYGYLIIRGDGQYAIKHRANATDVHTVQDWTPLASMKKADEKGVATNTVSFEVKSDSVRAFVNGEQVHAWGRNYWTAEGIAGLRVNHMLDVHVSNYKITPLP